MSFGLRAIVALLMLLGLSSEADAVRFRRPFRPDTTLSAAFDNNRGPGLRDYGCNGNTYENHRGTDFRLYFNDVLAMAPATVVATNNGCSNYGSLANFCGGGCGNYVKLRFANGTEAQHCHMQLNSIVVRTGQRVTCGQKLGVSASSGRSTGPHLHITYIVSGNLKDLYSGRCSNSSGYWVQQRGYLQAPGTDCEQVCQCSPGAVQSRGCGRCGMQSQRCGSDCQWAAWDVCRGEGPCSPGQVDTEACCDCGHRKRTCSASCKWNGFDACAGEDPPGAPACDTGEPGVCADGRKRCLSGCLSCVRWKDPSPELCDGLDNDCDGPVDEGSPRTLGPVPPPFAAELVDLSLPRTLPVGISSEGWVAFRNVGVEPWHPGELYLRADATLSGRPSRLTPESGWAAYDVPAVLSREIAPGESVVFRFPLAAHPAGEETELLDVDETFSLVAPTGNAIACPEAAFEVAVATAGVASSGSTTASRGIAAPSDGGGCASFAGGGSSLLAPALVVALRLVFRLRRKRSSV